MRVIKNNLIISSRYYIIDISGNNSVSIYYGKKGDPIYTRQSIENEGQRRLKLNSLAACFEIQSETLEIITYLNSRQQKVR